MIEWSDAGSKYSNTTEVPDEDLAQQSVGFFVLEFFCVRKL